MYRIYGIARSHGWQRAHMYRRAVLKRPMTSLKYLSSYPQSVQAQAQDLISQGKLESFLESKYPNRHGIYNDTTLREYVMQIKSQYLKKSSPLSKVIYDPKIHVINNALGLHSFVSRVQDSKLTSKNEIRIAMVFKNAPEDFLKMIVVHELAHLKQKDHNKAFYQLCQHMLPEYFQLEFDLRLYLTFLDF